jgi:hypothetical protein
MPTGVFATLKFLKSNVWKSMRAGVTIYPAILSQVTLRFKSIRGQFCSYLFFPNAYASVRWAMCIVQCSYRPFCARRNNKSLQGSQTCTALAGWVSCGFITFSSKLTPN